MSFVAMAGLAPGLPGYSYDVPIANLAYSFPS